MEWCFYVSPGDIWVSHEWDAAAIDFIWVISSASPSYTSYLLIAERTGCIPDCLSHISYEGIVQEIFKKMCFRAAKKILSNAYVLLCYNCVYTVFCIPLPFVCIVSYKHRAYFSLALTNLFLMTCFNMYCWITITTLTGLVFIEHNSPAMCVLCFWIECSLVKSSNEKHPQPHPDWLSPLFIWGTSAGWTEAFWIKTLQAGLTGRISAICLWMAANQSPISHVFPRVWVWQSVKKEKYLCKHFDYLSSSYLTYIKIWLTVIYEMCNIVNI